jgi:mycofactocin system glycosyltransferase
VNAGPAKANNHEASTGAARGSPAVARPPVDRVAHGRPALPIGFRVAIDPGTRQLDETTLFGGSPTRVARLSPAGVRAWTQLRDGTVTSPSAGVLARRLSDGGLLHPRPAPVSTPDVTVIIPARDRADHLAYCLTSVVAQRVLVVDDGSADPAAIATVAADHGATLLRRPLNGGPAAARNTGLAHVHTELVAFLDSDCVAPPGWIEALAGHFADPLVAAVAPRVVAPPATTWSGRYTEAAGSLDLGPREARVLPGTRVAYVPTAALLVRRSALEDVGVFDQDLRYGEDVDLVWRLHGAGLLVRYDPSVRVRHRAPDSWRDLLVRRFHYGTSAGPLALRHPAAMAPVVLQPWLTAGVAAALARRPVVAGIAFAGAVVDVGGTLHRAGLPSARVLAALASGTRQTWLGIGRYGTRFAAPVLAATLVAPGGSTAAVRRGRRAAAASLLFGPPLTAWARRRTLDPVRFALGDVAAEVAYGAGVLAGCLHARTTRPLRPAVTWRQFRTGTR